jgi:hypothetical protein
MLIDEHKTTIVGRHAKEAHGEALDDLLGRFSVLRKCKHKFDCLVFEMLFIKELKPSLNGQSDSIKFKLF